jgi:nitrate/nitrite-specific signal transduction histidine kinase
MRFQNIPYIWFLGVIALAAFSVGIYVIVKRRKAKHRRFDIVPVAWDAVVKTIDTGVMVLNLQNRVITINPSFEKIIGRTASAVSTKQVEKVCEDIPELAKACLDKNITHTDFSVSIENLPKVFKAIFSPLTDDKGATIGRLVTVYEITAKMLAQDMLSKQQWKLAVNEEKERMTQGLHDTLGQVLGFINLQIQDIMEELNDSGIETVADRLDQLADATQLAHSEIRDYRRCLRDPAYMGKDFITVLRTDILNLQKQAGLNVKTDIQDGFSGNEISPNIRIQILTIIKEALENISKHAEAKNALITVSLKQKEFYVAVVDDGKGFDTVQKPNMIKTKSGLDIMREHAVEIGGSLNIESASGQGCRITLNVPVKQEDASSLFHI